MPFNAPVVSSKEIVADLLDKIIPLTSGQRLLDSAIRDFETLKLSKLNVAELKAKFKDNWGTFFDGSEGQILPAQHSGQIYFKFTTNLSLLWVEGITNSMDAGIRKITSMRDRAIKELPTFNIFVNGIKVPDKHIYVYLTEGVTDVLIPIRFINEALDFNVIFVEKRIFTKYRYINRYENTFVGGTYVITLDNDEMKCINFNRDRFADSILIYLNGKLYTNTKNYTAVNKIVTISNIPLSSYTDFEVIIDVSVRVMHSRPQMESSFNALFNLPEDYGLYLENGPIARDTCYFFIDGVRIPNENIAQVGRFNFSQTVAIQKTMECTLIVTDKHYIDDTTKRIYGDDFYLSNFLGVEGVSRILIPKVNRETVNPYLDSTTLDFNAIMNMNGTLYSPAYFMNIYNQIQAYPNPDDITKILIKNRPYLLRNLLEHFGKTEIYKTVTHTASVTRPYTYTFGFKNTFTDNKDYVYIVDINGKYIPDTKYNIIDDNVVELVSLPVELFKLGINYVHLQALEILDSQKLKYAIYDIDIISDNNGVYQFVFDTFNNIQTVDDYLCLEYTENEDGYYYDPGLPSKFGWKVKKDVYFQLNSNNTTSLIFNTLPSNKFCIYSKRFVYKFSYTAQRNIENINDVVIPISNSTAAKLPVIPNGKIIVYLNENLLLEGIDYFFRHPNNHDLTTYTVLGLKRKIKKDDVINILFTFHKNIKLSYKSGITNNKYGLIYFGNLPFPYSPKYINLYVNDRFVYEDEVEILSDKLIRLPFETTPFLNIYADTAFNFDYEELSYFYDSYTQTPLEAQLAVWFKDFDFSKSVEPSDLSLGNAVYMTFNNNVSINGIIPNIILPKKDVIRYELLINAYLLWLKSDETKAIIKISSNLRKRVMDFFSFYSEDFITNTRTDIVVSKDSVLFNDLVFTNKCYPHTISERNRTLLHFAKFYSIGTRTLFEHFRDYLPVANKLYPRDLPKVISSRSLIDKSGKDLVLGGRKSIIYTEHPATF
jgi:hypothetical protein